MWVRRVVFLKAIVTEEFRAGKLEEIEAALARVSTSLQQLDYQEERLRSLPETVPLEERRAISHKIALERRRQDRLQSRLQESQGQLQGLPEGSEFLIGQMEGLVEAKPGMAATSLTHPAEIILKDGIVVEVRE